MKCENHGLTFNVPTITATCTEEDLQLQQLKLFCGSIGQAYVDGSLKDSRCSQINLNSAEIIVSGCLMKADSAFCVPQTDGLASDFRKYNSILNSNCDHEIDNAPGCRSTCRNKLIEAKDALGCCINYDDMTISDTAAPCSTSLQSLGILWN